MINLLGFNIYDEDKSSYIKSVINRYEKNEKVIIVSGNPEILYSSTKDSDILSVCQMGDIIPDGIGVLIAGRLKGRKFKEKIAGIEVTEGLLRLSMEKGIRAYFLGSKQEIVEQAVKVAREKFDANIVGYHNGFFDLNNCSDIIEDINNSKADALFVAMGCPRQEIFIKKYMNDLNCRIFMGVGGSIDVFAGKVDRAPKWMINMGLEWLYRVSKEPWRIRRLTSIPKFILKVMFSR